MVRVFDSGLRMNDGVFIVLVGIVVQVVIALVIKETRASVIIRGGVRDWEMVEA